MIALASGEVSATCSLRLKGDLVDQVLPRQHGASRSAIAFWTGGHLTVP